MKRLATVLLAFGVLTTALVWAQPRGRIQLASPDGFTNGPVRIQWGFDDPSHYDIFTPLGVDVIIPLHFYIFGTNLSDWNAFAIDLLYDTAKMDIGVYKQDGTLVWLSTVQGTFTALRLVAQPNPPIAGLAAGNVVSAANSPTTNVQLGIAAAAATRNPFSDNPALPTRPYNVLVTDSDYAGTGNLTPFLLKLKAPFVQAGQTFDFRLGPQGVSFISRGTRYSADTILGTWHIVPEPASMIALGSGLVGLLALRRRRKA